MPPDPVAPSSDVATDTLSRLAPEAGAALARLQAEVWAVGPADRLALVDLRVAQLLRDDPVPWSGRAVAPAVDDARRQELSRWSTSPLFSDQDRVVLEFTEQFVIDVAGIDESLRTGLRSALGRSGMVDVVVALFVLDYGRRVTMALDRLFPEDPAFGSSGAVEAVGAVGAHGDADGRGRGAGPGAVTGSDLLAGIDRLSRSVALLDAVDPVTTELVRLRGARQHNCRLCQSTRSARALDQGADEALLDSTERYESSTLSESRKVALRLTDALITGPAALDRSMAAQVHRWFAPAQVVELVMDVMRNSGQKIAVALAADDPHVTSGIERFDITADGDVEYLA